VKSANVSVAKIDAGKGWQPSRLTVMGGQEYEYSAAGYWNTSKDGPSVDADGDQDGLGKLVGVLLTESQGEYALGEPFELGKFGSFTAPGDGNLYLRCRDGWTGIADNKGSVSVKLKLKDKGPPLAPPKTDDDKKKPKASKPKEEPSDDA